jgi:ABC-type transport system involved in multi-copper enzyme maturation permease subunit
VTVYAIALNTFREAVRDKILYTLLFFALLMIAGAGVAADLTIGEYDKILRDLGLAAINLFGVAIAIFVGIGLVYKEIEKKTIYTIASKPVARWQFLVGKYLGLVVTLGAEVLIMGLGFGLLLLLAEGEPSIELVWAIWLTWIELLVVTAVAILFSCFSTPTLSALFTVAITLIGRMTAGFKSLAEAADSPGLQSLANLAYRVVPDLQTYNIRSEAAYGKAIEWEFVAYATGEGLLWVALLLAVASVIFQYRDFK